MFTSRLSCKVKLACAFFEQTDSMYTIQTNLVYFRKLSALYRNTRLFYCATDKRAFSQCFCAWTVCCRIHIRTASPCHIRSSNAATGCLYTCISFRSRWDSEIHLQELRSHPESAPPLAVHLSFCTWLIRQTPTPSTFYRNSEFASAASIHLRKKNKRLLESEIRAG